jgi:hypothetical protein
MSHIESDSGNITVVQRITPSLRVAASSGLLSREADHPEILFVDCLMALLRA